jgi:hypothetical protein
MEYSFKGLAEAGTMEIGNAKVETDRFPKKQGACQNMNRRGMFDFQRIFRMNREGALAGKNIDCTICNHQGAYFVAMNEFQAVGK